MLLEMVLLVVSNKVLVEPCVSGSISLAGVLLGISNVVFVPRFSSLKVVGISIIDVVSIFGSEIVAEVMVGMVMRTVDILGSVILGMVNLGMLDVVIIVEAKVVGKVVLTENSFVVDNISSFSVCVTKVSSSLLVFPMFCEVVCIVGLSESADTVVVASVVVNNVCSSRVAVVVSSVVLKKISKIEKVVFSSFTSVVSMILSELAG